MIVYVLCPHMSISGGPELLHQLVFYLNHSGIEAYGHFRKKWTKAKKGTMVNNLL